MKLEPLAPWWLLIPAAVAAMFFVGRHLWSLRTELRAVWLPWVRRSGVVITLLLVGLGPSLAVATSSPGITNLDVFFVVDTTASMGAQDYENNTLRIDGVKQDLLALGKKLQGAHTAIISFDSKASLLLPLTTDGDTFNSTVKAMNREIYSSSNGSTIDRPIDLLKQQLKNSKLAHPERSRLVFYLGDGEQTSKTPAKSFKPLAEYIDGGGVLGYGTAAGAKMLRYGGIGGSVGKQVYVTVADAATKSLIPATSKLDATALQKIATETNVLYQQRTKDTSLDDFFAKTKAYQLVRSGEKISTYLNLYWLFSVPLVLLLFCDLKLVFMEYLTLRNPKEQKRE